MTIFECQRCGVETLPCAFLESAAFTEDMRSPVNPNMLVMTACGHSRCSGLPGCSIITTVDTLPVLVAYSEDAML